MSDKMKLNKPGKCQVMSPLDFSIVIDDCFMIEGTPDIVHEEIDEEMCRILESLGYGEGVEIFRKMNFNPF